MNSKQKTISVFIICLILLGNFNVRAFGQTEPAAPTTSETATETDGGSGTGNVIGGILGAGVGTLATVTIIPTILALTVIVQPIGGLLVMLGSALTDLTLNLNYKILDKNNSFVQIGWRVCRDLTNLGFVLFIIVIAIGNILRVKQYQIKNVLWKLIVAALLVNFSLLFAGVFVDFSNMLTNFFIQKASGGELIGLGLNLTKNLSVQQWNQVKDSSSFLESFTGGLTGVLAIVSGAVFSVIFTFIAALCLLAMAIMFLTRFVWLSALLILLPLACLFWILPITESLWKKWWSQFFRWIAFAPLASFFIYLAFALAEKSNELLAPLVQKSQGIGTKNPMQWASLPIANFFGTVSNFVIMVGFLMGGLYAADKMGVHTASTFIGWAEKSGGWASNLAKDASKRKTTGLLRMPFGEKGKEKSVTERMSAWSARHPRLSRLGLGAGIRGLAGFAAAGGEDLIKTAENKIKDMGLNEKIAMLGYADAPTKIALLNDLRKNNALDKVPQTMNYIGEKERNNFASFGQIMNYLDLEKCLGINAAMKKNINAPQIFREESRKFFAGFSKKDWAKIKFDTVFADPEKSPVGFDKNAHTAYQEAVAFGIAMNNPGDVRKILTDVKSQNFERALSSITRISSEIRSQGTPNATDIADQITETLKKTMARRLTGATDIPEPETTA